MRYFAVLTLLMFFIGCGNPQREIAKTETPTQSKHELASDMKVNNVPMSQRIAMQQEAVDDLRKGKSKESAYGVLSKMGYFLCRSGNYVDGLKYLLEANDSLKTMDPDSINAEEAVKLTGNLSNLYARLGLYDEALAKSREAISLCFEKEINLLPDLWRMRGNIFNIHQMADSAIACFDKALEASKALPEEKDSSLRHLHIIANEDTRAWFFIENQDYAPDSILPAINTLEKNLNDYPHNYSTNMLLIGRGYVLLGNVEKGLPMMEKAVELFREKEDTESVEFGLRFLAMSYAETGNRKLNDIYMETIALHDTLAKRSRDNELMGKDFQYRTMELKSDVELLNAKLYNTRQHIIYLTLVALIVIAATVTFFISRRRQHKAILQQKEQSISSLISDRIALNSQIEKLNEKLLSQTDDDGSNIVLNPLLLDKENEISFRKMFSEIYPGFIENLRMDFKGITTSNELLCMLIKLHKSNEEISLALGISRESVVTARYRLRNRFKLPKETDLNEFIQNR